MNDFGEEYDEREDLMKPDFMSYFSKPARAKTIESETLKMYRVTGYFNAYEKGNMKFYYVLLVKIDGKISDEDFLVLHPVDIEQCEAEYFLLYFVIWQYSPKPDKSQRVRYITENKEELYLQVKFLDELKKDANDLYFAQMANKQKLKMDQQTRKANKLVIYDAISGVRVRKESKLDKAISSLYNSKNVDDLAKLGVVLDFKIAIEKRQTEKLQHLCETHPEIHRVFF